MNTSAFQDELLRLTAGIVVAHVRHSQLPAEALPEVIRSVYVALGSAASPTSAPGKPEPAVLVRKSVFPDYIVCLEDGKRFKTLRRHLKTSYGMTPEDYRERWDLPASYPMVAPNYGARRSALAKEMGLGRMSTPSLDAETPVRRIPEGVSGKTRKIGRRVRRDCPSSEHLGQLAA